MTNNKVFIKLTVTLLILMFNQGLLYAEDLPVIKVDFNEPSRSDMLEVLEPGYSAWPVAKDCQTASKTVDGVSFTVESDINMRVGWKKEWVQTRISNVRLLGDGLNLDPKDSEGAITLKITGLPAGTHSLKTFHNSWGDPETVTCWPITIFCNGDSVARVERSKRKAVAEGAATAMIFFKVESEKDTTVLVFRTYNDDMPADSEEKTSKEVTPMINGFELNTADITAYWPMDRGLNEVDQSVIEQASQAEVTDLGIKAIYVFESTVTKGSNLSWDNARNLTTGEQDTSVQSMCGIRNNAVSTGTDSDELTFVLKPQHAVTILPKKLRLSLGFNEVSDGTFIVAELRHGDSIFTIDTIHARTADKQIDLEYLTYTKGIKTYLSEEIKLCLRLKAPAGTTFYISDVSLSGDITESDQEVFLAKTEVYPKDEYGQVTPAAVYYVAGQTLHFEAQPSKGYVFRQWENDGDVLSDENPLIRSDFARDTVLTAVFETDRKYLFSCETIGDAANRVRITPEGEFINGNRYYQRDTKVTLSAWPADNNYFSHWEDADGTILSRANPMMIVVDNDYEVRAVFTNEVVVPLRAFPTADGYGRNATGGRGGAVVEVTNLSADANVEGSLPWAIRQHSGQPLTVVFRVSGIIESSDRYITLNRSNVTYAGQTAPGDGICFRKSKVKVNGNNVIMRNLRFRVGDELGLSLSAIGIENFHHVIIDHCSISWSTEENVTMYDNDSTTMQYCIISEPLYNSNNYKGARAYGSQWGGEPASYLHNLLAHCKTRAPRFNGSSNNDYHGFVDVRNNVMYNCGGSYGGEIRGGGVSCFNQLVANYYRRGPVTDDNFVGPSSPYGQWYITGNVMEGNETATHNNWSAVNMRPENIALYRSDEPGDDFLVLTETAEEAYQSVLAKAGAFPRDPIDQRIINEASGISEPTVIASYGKPGIIDTPSEAGGWPEYHSSEAPKDSDHDGMPDEWEVANGLDPNNPEDRNRVTTSGYTCLEVYLNGLMGETIPLSFPTAIKEVKTSRPVCYLNQESKMLYVYGEEPVTAIHLYSIDGRRIASWQGKTLRQANLSSIPSGLYLIQLKTASGSMVSCKISNQ